MSLPATSKRRVGRINFGGMAFIVPSLFFVTVVVVIPVVMSFWYSFTNYSMIGNPQWVGWDNYERLITDSAFRQALFQTVIYTVISVPLQTIGALVVANILANRFRNRLGQFVRSALFIPVMASLVLTGTVWRYLLAYDGGAVNGFIGLFSAAPIDWLGRSDTALIVISLVSAWKNIGYFLVIYYAGMMDIPQDLYEASSLDGANKFQQFIYITIPSLRKITFMVVILGTIWSFQVFDLIYTMTGGGPGDSTSTLVYLIYQTGFRQFRMGYSSAIAVVLFVIILIVSIIQNSLMNKDE